MPSPEPTETVALAIVRALGEGVVFSEAVMRQVEIGGVAARLGRAEAEASFGAPATATEAAFRRAGEMLAEAEGPSPDL